MKDDSTSRQAADKKPVITRATLASARRTAAQYGVQSLLSFDADPKTRKSNRDGSGYLTAIMYLAPASASGQNLCASASPGCIAGCLFSAGVPFMLQHKTKARLARSRFYLEQPEAFCIVLAGEILAHVRRCEQYNARPAIRLNGTSDIIWERVAPWLFSMFPNVQWYDYTKHKKRMLRRWRRPHNYHLTFSRSEENNADCLEILESNPHARVAVVFSTSRFRELPKVWRGHRVLNGDRTDLRFNDKGARIIGLRAKGKARRDDSGFVVQVAPGLMIES